MNRPKIKQIVKGRPWGDKICVPESTREIRRQVKGRPRAAHWRPTKRSQCPKDRPCPYVGCQYNLVLEVTMGGALKYTLGSPEDALAPWVETDGNCLFDHLVDGVPMTLDDIAKIFCITRERVRQIEGIALNKIKKSAFAREVLNELTDHEPDNQGWVLP